jgi:hypothetical protein
MIRRLVPRLSAGRRRAQIVVALAVSLATLAGASSALASSYQHAFAPFEHCPVNTPGVSLCLVSTVTSGEFHLGNNTVPINKTILLQGGYNATTHELVAATDGNTLSKTPLVLPGGLLGIELLGNLTEVTVTAELAGTPHLNLNNIGGAGPLVSLPLKVKLDNPLLGNACYIGSDTEQMLLNLTDGTTNPPPPNQPISGKFGTAVIKDEGRVLGATNNTLVDNAFSAPGANGCAGILSLVVDLAVDLKAGLPAAAGTNTAIMNGSLEQTESRIVKTEQEIPLFGRCVKVEGVKEGKVIVYNGKYSSSNCVTEAFESKQPGKYEWSAGPGPNRKFTGTGLTTAFETVGKTRIACTATSSEGEYTGTKTEKVTYTFTGCQNPKTHNECQSAGAGPGEIQTSPLVGELGLITDVEPLLPVVGVDLKPESSSSLTQFECGGLEESVAGSVIGAVASVDKMSPTMALKFKATKGVQAPEAFEELPKDVPSTTLTSGSSKTVEGSGVISSIKYTSEEPIEIKARAF